MIGDQLPDGCVVTVLGPVAPADLGPTMMHEHVFVDLRGWWHPPAERLASRAAVVDVPVSLEVLGTLRRDPLINRHNLVLDEEEVAVIELRKLAEAGGRTVVDMTSLGLGGRRELLPSVAQRSGVHIVAGAGFYKEETLDETVRSASDEEIDALLRLEVAGGQSGIVAGVIGEMGTSAPMTDGEARRLDVAARLAAELGLSLHIHLEPGGRDGVRAMGVAVAHLAPERVVLGHVDYEPEPDRGYIRALAETGAFMSLDTFGLEHHMESIGWVEPRDLTRMALLAWLVEQGYGQRLVASHDVAIKTSLRTYGGFGYDHFLRDIAPQLAARGIDQVVLDAMVLNTPARILAIRRDR